MIIFGGSSEIANAIEAAVSKKFPNLYSRTLRISTSMEGSDVIKWNPTDSLNLESILPKILFEKGDLVILAIGHLGKSQVNVFDTFEIEEVKAILNINFNLNSFLLFKCYENLKNCGGGKILLISSVAGYPVLKSNLVYGTSKLALDTLALGLQKISRASNVRISIVRCGFVPSKLNKDRSPTPFAITANEVGRLVAVNFDQDIIWAPKIFKFICFFLSSSSFLQQIASRKVMKSKRGL
jgi:NAD(P)-dependent dehydrogenase (short-subunit alcohol dehydrogenase family)